MLFFILHKHGGALPGLKCFLIIFVLSVLFVDLNHVGFQPSDNRYKCLHSTNVVIKQTDSIILATSGDLKCYTCDQQCFISVCSAVFSFSGGGSS